MFAHNVQLATPSFLGEHVYNVRHQRTVNNVLRPQTLVPNAIMDIRYQQVTPALTALNRPIASNVQIRLMFVAYAMLDIL
jgi:hypothetical protein